MSDSPFTDPVEAKSLGDAVAAVRAAGHRLTAARRLLLEALFAADGPASAEHLARRIGSGAVPMDVASVHRNLAQLEELGLVRHVHIGHGPGLYALIGSEQREFLACERCGRVTSVEPARLDSIRRSIRRRFGYEARFTHFPILGLCRNCAAQRGRKKIPDGGEPQVSHHHHEHEHDAPHTHKHSHGEVEHEHPHTSHDHQHTEHDHEHSHGDYVHSHPHVHEKGLENEHDHGHEG